MTKVRLVLDVTYDELNGMAPRELPSLLRMACDSAICRGLLTEASSASVAFYNLEATVIPAALEEDAIADFMRQRIENGALSAEEVPMRLARYGLMDRVVFVEEMRKRMEGMGYEKEESAEHGPCL